MRLPTNDSDRSPAEDFLDKRLDIRKVGLIVPGWTPIRADNTIQLLPSLGQHLRKRTAGEDECDERRTGCVAPSAKKIASQGGDFLWSEIVLWGLVEDLPRVALLLFRVVGSFFG